MTKIKNRVVLLTGASRGIGFQLGLRLAQLGALVIGVARDEIGLQKLVHEIEEMKGKAAYLLSDITDISSLDGLVNKATDIFGPIDILVNNAGMVNYLPFHKYSLNEMQSVFNLNIISAMELTRLILPEMLRRKRGHIVNMASLSGKIGSPYGNVYVASKAAMIMWTHALRTELHGNEVSISLICPSYVADIGAIQDLKIETPRRVPKNDPQVVIDRTVEAIEKDLAEVVIHPGLMPVRPLLAIAQVFPTLQDRLLRAFGVTNAHRQFAWGQVQKDSI